MSFHWQESRAVIEFLCDQAGLGQDQVKERIDLIVANRKDLENKAWCETTVAEMIKAQQIAKLQAQLAELQS